MTHLLLQSTNTKMTGCIFHRVGSEAERSIAADYNYGHTFGQCGSGVYVA